MVRATGFPESEEHGQTRRYLFCAITSQTGKARLPTHIYLSGPSVGLNRDSVILLEQIRTLDKTRLRERMGHLGEEAMSAVDSALAVSFGLKG